MANLDTDLYTAQKSSRANTSRNASPNLASGQVEFATIKYALTGSEAAADVLRLCVLPAGIIPVPELSSISFSGDPGTALTVDVGTTEDLDGWADGIVLDSAGSTPINFCTPAQPAWAATPTSLASDSDLNGQTVVKMTLAAVTTLTAARIMKVTLAYKRNR